MHSLPLMIKIPVMQSSSIFTQICELPFELVDLPGSVSQGLYRVLLIVADLENLSQTKIRIEN